MRCEKMIVVIITTEPRSNYVHLEFIEVAAHVLYTTFPKYGSRFTKKTTFIRILLANIPSFKNRTKL